MKHNQFPFCYTLYVVRQSPGELSIKYPLRFPVSKRLDHIGIVTPKDKAVKHCIYDIKTSQEVLLPLPQSLRLRLQRVAQAPQQSLTDVLLHAVAVGSPPNWEDAPAEFQADLATLERLNDEALWQIAGSRAAPDIERHQELLDKNAAGTLTDAEQHELTQRRTEADRFMLRKEYADALLRWRSHKLPSADKM